MYYNNRPYGGSNRGMFGASRYQYEPLAPGMQQVQAGSLVGKVLGLLAFSFLFAFVGTVFGGFLFATLGIGTFWVAAIGGFIVLIILQFVINRSPLNLFLLYLFTFLEGVSISPIIAYYLVVSPTILAEAFLITALVSISLAIYAWTTHRDFSRLGDILFFGLILLIISSIVGLIFGGIFHTQLFVLLISIVGVAIFSGYVLFYVQRAKYMADTMPNAIGLTVSLFITVLNLFLYILQILAILQGGGGRRQ